MEVVLALFATLTVWLIVWLVAAVVGGILASNKNRCVWCWTLACFLLPLLVFVILVLPARTAPTAASTDKAGRPPLQGLDKIEAALQARRRAPAAGGQAAETPAGRFLDGPSKTKICDDCANEMPAAARVCTKCGYRWAPALPGSASSHPRQTPSLQDPPRPGPRPPAEGG